MKKLLFSALTAGALLLGPTAQAANFNDVPSSNTLKYEIDYLVEQGVINGYKDGSFRPNDMIQKQHIAKILVNSLQLDTSNVADPGYKDIPKTHIYYKEIAAAQNAGIFGKAEYFQPNSTISRGFMARVLVRAYELNMPNLAGFEPTDFVDVQKNNAYYKDVSTLSALNITKGSYREGNAYFDPNKAVSRAHFTAFLARASTLTIADVDMDTDAVYTYHITTADGDTYLRSYDYLGNDGKNEVWENIEGDFPNILTYYGRSEIGYSAISEEPHYELYAHLPLAIGVNQIEDPVHNERTSVIATDATIQVNNTTYKNVVVIEVQGFDFGGYKERYYIKSGIGVVKIESLVNPFKMELVSLAK